MSNDTQDVPTKAVPVLQWAVNLESIEDEAAALTGWHSLVRAQGWSPVGEPEVHRHPDGIQYDWPGGVVTGRLVKYPGLTVAAEITNALEVPV